MESSAMDEKTVFVTVGTTQFDSLIKMILEEETLAILWSKGFSRVVLQIGNGKYIPPTIEFPGLKVSYFRLKTSIAEDFASADLVISHAGAGSCLEALEAGKPLIAVVNNTLMANHQTELAEELARKRVSFYCYPNTLRDTLANLNLAELRPYKPGQPNLLTEYLDRKIKVI